jgi:hypothetical protein
MPVLAEHIPDALRGLPRWVCWRWTWNGKKWDKPPLDPRTGGPAKSTDPATWVPFDLALEAHQMGDYDGVGITLGAVDETGLSLCGLDLDGCLDADGALSPLAGYLLGLLDTYAERSPSGTGVKALCWGRLPRGKRADHARGIELYESGRYFTVTGRRLESYPAEVMERGEQLGQLHAAVFPPAGGKHQLGDRELALSALAALNPSRAVGYHSWLGVGMVLYSVDPSDAMLALWDEWSRLAPDKYTPGACAAKWRSFGRRGGLTLGSLIHWAREDGWTPPRITIKGAGAHEANGKGHFPAGSASSPDGTPLASVAGVMCHAPPYAPFPVDALPRPAAGFVSAAAAALGCDPAYVALPVLAALASTIGNTRVIRIKGSWHEPSILWTCVVGESGTLKSPAWHLAVRPLFRLQKKLLLEYRATAATYHEKLAEFKARKKKCEAEGVDPGRPPEEPVLQRVVCSDITIEKTAAVLEDNPRGTLLAANELAAWFGSFTRYKGKNGGTDVSYWLQAWEARPWVYDRKTPERPTLFIDRASVSVTGGIQPGVLARQLAPEYFDCGLAARMLLAYPPRRPKQWSEAEVALEVARGYEDLLESLLRLKMAKDHGGEPAPQEVRLEGGAKAEWTRFYDEWAREQAAADGEVAAMLSKMEGYAARFALVHHVATHVAEEGEGEPAPVAPASIRAGVTLARWFAGEARRVYALLKESEDQRKARELVELIARHGGRMTVRSLMRANSYRYRTSEDAEEALEALAKAGLATREDGPAPQGGGHRSRTYVLNMTHDSCDTRPPEGGG